MAFISLTEAVDRVLARLAEQREGKEAGGVETARQLAAVEGEDYRLRRGLHGNTAKAMPRKTVMGRKARMSR